MRRILYELSRGYSQPIGANVRGMRRGFKVEKLSDEFGQYELILKCAACGHERRILPRSLANVCGWDAKLEEVTRRLRCSKCGERRCTARALPPVLPRGYKSH